MVSPASRQMSTSRVASAASLSPNPLKAPSPPNVAVPRLRTGTLKPEAPSCRCSMAAPRVEDRMSESIPDAVRPQPWPSRPDFTRSRRSQSGAMQRRWEESHAEPRSTRRGRRCRSRLTPLSWPIDERDRDGVRPGVALSPEAAVRRVRRTQSRSRRARPPSGPASPARGRPGLEGVEVPVRVLVEAGDVAPVVEAPDPGIRGTGDHDGGQVVLAVEEEPVQTLPLK